MKAVQSFWSLPSHEMHGKENRFMGGWLNKKYYYMGISLSCLLLRRQFKEVELTTDSIGYDLLCDRLKLPYTQVNISLDRLQPYSKGLWILAKLQCYKEQQTPFLHVDNDVFIWKKITNHFRNSDLIAQSPELYHYNVYKSSLVRLIDNNAFIPKFFEIENLKETNFTSINAGVLGGNNIDFIQKYVQEALEFINNNIELFSLDNTGVYNMLIEQYIFNNLAKRNNLRINFLIPKLSANYKEVTEFDKIPNISKFIHLIGFAKRNEYGCQQVESRLRYEFPVEYRHISNTIQDILAKSDNSTEQFHYGVNNYSQSVNKPYNDFIKAFNSSEYINITDLLKVKKARSYISVKEIFHFMSTTSKKLILEQKLTISDNCIIGEYNTDIDQDLSLDTYLEGFVCKKTYYIFQKLPNRIDRHKLEGWLELLIHFIETPISGNDLINYLVEELGTEKRKFINNGVLDFVTQNLVYTGFLKVKIK